MELDRLQQRLDTHFASLKGLRAASGYPVYALEHGLDDNAIGGAITALAAQRRLDNNHWLVWIAIAAEIGYGFEGGQYWDSFAERVPGWLTFGSRYRVRGWFERFEREYRGFKPTGAWAEHRTIISWPIMHAVLPADLQPTFTQTMHRLRFDLLDDANGETLTRRFRSLAANENTRFQKLAEQTDLVRHLLRALSDEDQGATEHLLSPPLFRRLLEDIRRTPSARAWLADTQRTVTRMRGAASGTQRAGGARSPAGATLSIDRPTLELRRTGAASWDAFVDLPTLAPLAATNDEAHQSLRSTKCALTNGGGTWFPPGWLLEGPHARRLQSWPEAGKSLVRLAQENALLEAYFAAHFALSSGPIWVCRISRDGRAIQLLGRQVRPGGDYILLHQQHLPRLAELPLTEAAINCTGIQAHRLSVPPQLSQRAIEDIKALGLSLLQTVRIWPAGTTARDWDGEGNAEWLTTEAMTLGVSSDFPVSSYSIALGSDAHITIAAPPEGSAAFICLPPLPAGEHKLRVTPVLPAGQPSRRDTEGTLNIRVRPPRPWHSDSVLRTGLSVHVDPVDGDLDDLIANELVVHLLGPAGRKADIRIVAPGENSTDSAHEISLPREIRDWTPYLTENVMGALLSSRRADLLVSAGELGEKRITLEHEPPPLAWRVKRDLSGATVQLIDEAGIESGLQVSFMSFENPIAPVTLDAERCKAGLAVAKSGGLYRAIGGKYDEKAIVGVPLTGTYSAFDALGVQPQLPPFNKGADPEPLLRAAALWAKAPTRDVFALSNKGRVTAVLDERLRTLMCGGVWWTRAEDEFAANGRSSAALDTFAQNWSSSYDERGVIAVIRMQRSAFVQLSTNERIEWLADPLARRGICTDVTLVDTAWRLVAGSDSIADLPLDEVAPQIPALLAMPSTLRLARFMQLALIVGEAER